MKPNRSPIQALLLGAGMLSCMSGMGQLTSFSSQYSTTGNPDTRIYGITKTYDNDLLTIGIQASNTGLSGGAYPGYLSKYQDMRLLQTDLDGNVIFNRTYGTGYDDRAFDAVRGESGEMLVVGHTGQGYTAADRRLLGLPPNQNNAAVSILRIDASGNLLSDHNYDLGGFDDHAFSIVRKNTGSYYILGRSYRNVYDRNVITFMNANANGEVLAASIIHDNFQSDLMPRKMIRTNDGGYLIAAVKEVQGGSVINSPDPVGWNLQGSGVLFIKLDASESLQYAKLIKPTATGSFLIGVKDMVEDQSGNVVVVGNSSEGDYILKLNAAGLVVVSKAFVNGPDLMGVRPTCVIRNGSGFMVSGFASNGRVPRIVFDANLNVLTAHSHHFGQSIYALENVTGGLQFFAGKQSYSFLMKWPVSGAMCWEFVEDTEVEDLPLIQEAVTLQKQTTPFQELDNAQTTTPPSTRMNNCITSTKMQEATAGVGGSAVTISPNPAHDRIQLDLPGEGSSDVQLLDLQGRQLLRLSLPAGQHSLPVADLEAGVYLLRIQGAAGLCTHKLSVQH